MAQRPQVSPEQFPVGQRVKLPGHFLEPVTLEGIRFIGSGYECRVRLADGTPRTKQFCRLKRGQRYLGKRL